MEKLKKFINFSHPMWLTAYLSFLGAIWFIPLMSSQEYDSAIYNLLLGCACLVLFLLVSSIFIDWYFLGLINGSNQELVGIYKEATEGYERSIQGYKGTIGLQKEYIKWIEKELELYKSLQKP